MTAVRDLTGLRFGRLVVRKRSASDRGRAMWCCRCDCGVAKVICGKHLRNGLVVSCGCLKSERIAAFNRAHKVIHGRRNTPEYQVWSNMKDRCYRSTHPGFRYWGGAGVTVCLRWLRSFEAFLEDMGERPPGMVRSRPLYSLDRYPDRDGNYEPDNCRWATAKQQANNRRVAKKRGSR